MEYDVSKQLLDLKGVPTKDLPSFAVLFDVALNTDGTGKPQERLKRYEICKKIIEAQDGKVDLSLDEAMIIKNAVYGNENFTNLVIGRVEEFLERK